MQIPDEALDKHVALLGMTGSGKTSVIKQAIVEPDLDAERRVIIITPKDDWWGLRLSKTGKSRGYDIPIFGGRHADYPLNVKDAGLLAEAYGTMKGSAIFCTASLSVQDRARWFSAFAERLLAKNRGWIRVVIDEAHVFMPKQGGKGGGAIPAALHAGNELVSQGRSQGLRIVLASQRSAKLHNDSLTQCSCLIAMMLMAPHDRDAVKDWIEDQADPQRGKEIIASLANLDPGQAWVWAPRAKFLECVQFPRPSTFDSSAAPDDDTDAQHKLQPVNLDALKGKLAAVEAERAANDPAALKAEVAKLRAEIAKAKPAEADPKAIEAADKAGYERGFREGMQALAESLQAPLEKAGEIYLDAGEAIGEIKFAIDPRITPRPEPRWKRVRDIPTPAPTRAIKFTPTKGREIIRGTVERQRSNGALPPGERAVLIAAVQYQGVERDQLSVLTGYKRSSRDAYIQRLREKGLVDLNITDNTIIPTEAAEAVLGSDYRPLPTGAALRDYWENKLPEGEWRVLAIAIDNYPNHVERVEIDEGTNFKRSTRDAYIQRLISRRLLTSSGAGVRAADTLF